MIAFHVQLAAVSRGNYHLTLQWDEEEESFSKKIHSESLKEIWFLFPFDVLVHSFVGKKREFFSSRVQVMFHGWFCFVFVQNPSFIPLGSCRKFKRARQKCILIMHYWVTSYDIFGLYLILWWYQNLGRMLIKMLILTPLSPIISNLY